MLALTTVFKINYFELEALMRIVTEEETESTCGRKLLKIKILEFIKNNDTTTLEILPGGVKVEVNIMERIDNLLSLVRRG